MTEIHVTLSDVARTAEVSLATASRVLHGSGRRRVGSELRERVLQAASALQYAPNAHAQALARSSSDTVGVLVHDIGDPYFSAIASGVMHVATDHDLLVMIASTYRERTRELEYTSSLRGQRVRAIVLAASGFDDRSYVEGMTTELDAFHATGGRVVAVSRHELPCDTVQPDNVDGGAAIARHLVELGHRRIGVVSGAPRLLTVQDRLSGVRRALDAAGIELGDQHVVTGDFSRRSGAAGAATLLDANPDLTAIIALNDLMALGVLATLRERGVSVPDEVSVTGFDDIEVVSDLTPALTTVRVPMTALGERAMELALGARGAAPTTEVLPVEVVLRGSTGHAPD